MFLNSEKLCIVTFFLPVLPGLYAPIYRVLWYVVPKPNPQYPFSSSPSHSLIDFQYFIVTFRRYFSKEGNLINSTTYKLQLDIVQFRVELR